jgi:hypothetical protein
MESTLYQGLEYVKANSHEIKDEPFMWGYWVIEPGHIFDKIGTRERSSLKLTDANLKYCGRNGQTLFFSIKADNKDSADDGWYIAPSWVNNKTLLMQSSLNGFWDIRF